VFVDQGQSVLTCFIEQQTLETSASVVYSLGINLDNGALFYATRILRAWKESSAACLKTLFHPGITKEIP
jgi:hypothetical protein